MGPRPQRGAGVKSARALCVFGLRPRAGGRRSIRAQAQRGGGGVDGIWSRNVSCTDYNGGEPPRHAAALNAYTLSCLQVTLGDRIVIAVPELLCISHTNSCSRQAAAGTAGQSSPVTERERDLAARVAGVGFGGKCGCGVWVPPGTYVPNGEPLCPGCLGREQDESAVIQDDETQENGAATSLRPAHNSGPCEGTSTTVLNGQQHEGSRDNDDGTPRAKQKAKAAVGSDLTIPGTEEDATPQFEDDKGG